MEESGNENGFEFEAPSYFDFSTGAEIDDDSADAWFDNRKVSTDGLEDERLTCDGLLMLEDLQSPMSGKRAREDIETDKNNGKDIEEVEDEEEDEEAKQAGMTKKRQHKDIANTKSAKKETRAPPATVSKKWVPKLTKPQSPKLSTNTRLRGSKFIPSEEAEYQEILTSRQALLESTRAGVKRMQHALQGSPVRGNVERAPLTKPQPFKFLSDSRIKGIVEQSQQAMDKKQNSQSWKPHQLTQPQPFQFHTDERLQSARSRAAAENQEKPQPYVSLAEATAAFSSKTPERFRSSKVSVAETKTCDSTAPCLTRPQAPRFLTDTRLKGSSFKPHDEEELELIQKMPKFKARALNRKVLESAGDLGVPRIHKKDLTAPTPFNLATDARSSIIQAREARDLEAKDEHKPFKARPVSARMFQPQQSCDRSLVVTKNPTIPASPMLMTKQRGAHARPSTATTEEKFVFKARPMPISAPFEVFRDASKPIEFMPFNLSTEERGKLHEETLKRKLEEEEAVQEAARHFKARPLVEGVDELPPRIVIPVTEIQPFDLESEKLHAESVRKFQDKINQEEKKLAEMRLFKAHKFDKTQPQFALQPSHRPLTEVTNFTLSSDLRALDRQQFDAKIQQKEEQIKLLREQQIIEEQKRQAAEIAELRKTMTFKASEVPHSKPFVVKPSDAPLTEPKTPNFKTNERFGNPHHQEAY